MARGLHQCVWATCRRQQHDTRHHMTICRRRWQHARSAAASAGREQMMLSTICQRLRCCKGAMQVMANTFATRTAMQREHVEQPEHGENGADEQRLTPCLAISGAQRVEKSGISNLFIDFFCISNPCPGLSTPRTPLSRPHRDTSTAYGCSRAPRHHAPSTERAGARAARPIARTEP